MARVRLSFKTLFVKDNQYLFKSPSKQLQKVHVRIFVYHQLSHHLGHIILRRDVSISRHVTTIIQTNYIEWVAAVIAAATEGT